jgi:hypothetical protein
MNSLESCAGFKASIPYPLVERMQLRHDSPPRRGTIARSDRRYWFGGSRPVAGLRAGLAQANAHT